MPWYALYEGGEIEPMLPSQKAKDPAHAVAIFGNKLGRRFTLDDQGVVAAYMLRETTTEMNARFAERPPKIPVWIDDRE